jgi:hypothetical protein
MRKITEILDQPVPYQVYIKSPMEFNAKFTVEEIGYDCLITRYSADHIQVWEIVFAAIMPDGGYEEDIIGTGNVFTVFATIGAILKEFVRDYNPTRFMYTAKETSRIKLYRVFAAKIEQELGYTFEMKDMGRHTQFLFKKK